MNVHNKRFKLSLIATCLLMFNLLSSVYAEEESDKTLAVSINSFNKSSVVYAHYDSTTSILTLPSVVVDSSIFYQLTLKLTTTSPTILELIGATVLSDSAQYFASYDSNNLILTISNFSIDNAFYSAQLKRDTSLAGYQFELVSLQSDSSYKVVDTGQSNCYTSSGSSVNCSASGQDGAYTINIPSYTNNDDGTISDNITGLVWQKNPDTNGDGTIDSTDKLTQAAAVSYCSNLILANQSDWRLPDIKTMYSLIDFSGEDVSNYSGSDSSGLNPFINNNYFDFAYGDSSVGERLIDVQYATSTLYVSTTMNGDETMFGVNLADGRIKGYPITIGNNGKTFSVQCVRGDENYTTNNFIDNNDNTVSDKASTLMWQKNDSLLTKEWDAAISYCESDNTAGYLDWRLPNAKELQSILDYSRSPDTTDSAAINAIFDSTSMINEEGVKDWGSYWSSTTHLNSDGSGDNAVYVSFGRAMGYMNKQWLDVHGAGAQRSDPKSSSTGLNLSYETVIDANGNTAIIHGPQGDVVRINNYVRCVR
ncbi:MAG: DUF1566 domain-containing protein [Pseudomonadota bacterium]